MAPNSAAPVSFELDFSPSLEWAMHLRATPQLLQALRSAHNDRVYSSIRFDESGNHVRAPLSLRLPHVSCVGPIFCTSSAES